MNPSMSRVINLTAAIALALWAFVVLSALLQIGVSMMGLAVIASLLSLVPLFGLHRATNKTKRILPLTAIVVSMAFWILMFFAFMVGVH